MKRGIVTLFVFSFLIIACKKNPSEPNLICGDTGISGPVKYYLTPYDKSIFNIYKQSIDLTFVDSASNKTTNLSYSSNAQIWDETTAQSLRQGDTVEIGESAGIAYNYGTIDIQNLEYDFIAYPNGVDSIRIGVCGGNPLIQYPTFCSSWALNLKDTNKIDSTGRTSYLLLDNIALFNHIFYNVYLLHKGNYFSPKDSSNDCYYTKDKGIIAFTDKRYGKFWIRTN